MITEEQFNKLPVYARVEIERLRTNLRHAEEQTVKASGAGPTATKVYYYGPRKAYDDNPMYLPTERVTFKDGDFEAEVVLGKDHKERSRLYVLLANSDLLISPSCSNAVYIMGREE